MKELNLVQIALGSNLGDRYKNLQDAINLVFKELGRIINIARVYDTKALGFIEESHPNDFLNTCILVETIYSANTTLKILQNIENRLGRQRNTSNP